jgi:hypothetical protein
MENCHCVTAAARYRCRNYVYPNCHINETENNAEEAGLRKELQHADSDVYNREAEALFKEAWLDYEEKLARQYERFKAESIIQRHYGLVNALKADWKKSPILRAWQELSIGFAILLMMPYMWWQFVRKPEDSHKLPFID